MSMAMFAQMKALEARIAALEGTHSCCTHAAHVSIQTENGWHNECPTCGIAWDVKRGPGRPRKEQAA